MSETLVPVFDLGGVFVDWNPMYLFRKLFDTEEEAQWFQDNVCTLEWNLEFDAGDIYAEGVARLISRFPKYWREIQAYDARWKETFKGFIEGTIAIHDELIAAEVPTFSITNFSWEKWITCLGEWPFLEKFDGVRRARKIVKPDPRIFRVSASAWPRAQLRLHRRQWPNVVSPQSACKASISPPSPAQRLISWVAAQGGTIVRTSCRPSPRPGTI